MELAQAVVSGLLIGAIYALVAVGLTLIFGVMDIVNFAHGEFLMAAMYVTFFCWLLFGLDPLFAIPIAAVALALIGAVVYAVCIRRVMKGPPLSAIIVTFGVLVFMRGLAQLLFSADPRAVVGPFVEPYRLVAYNVVAGGPQLVAAVGALMSTGLVWWFVARTEVGSALSAVSEDADAARLMGIDPERMHLLAWIVGGASVGVAGSLLMNYYPVDPTIGAGFGLVAFVVVSLGGFGSLRGALAAGLLLGIVQTLVGLVAPAYASAAIFALYLVVVLIRPQGLFGTR
ncbi:MAG: branched-chain amino acid ABC transporter permease [Candidatus Dormibacteraeota bacterium]|nr:branched-chain amino acid ABC transporter permease [Candidatus Dormibacteraeota bacterium]